MPPRRPAARTIRELIARRFARAGARRELPRAPGACGFCGASGGVHAEPLVSGTLRLREGCGRCPRLPEESARVPACAACHAQKGGRGLYELFRVRFPGDRRFAERIPPSLERRYLAAVTECHGCLLTLDRRDIDGDGRLTVFDIDFVLHRR